MVSNPTIAQAIRKTADREIAYIWRSETQNIELDGDKVGEYVKLNISHDSDRKQFRAFIQFAHYDRSRGYETVSFTLHDIAKYPHGTVATQPIARYSAKALGEFETRVIDYLGGIDLLGGNGTHNAVSEAWRRASEIAMVTV